MCLGGEEPQEKDNMLFPKSFLLLPSISSTGHQLWELHG